MAKSKQSRRNKRAQDLVMNGSTTRGYGRVQTKTGKNSVVVQSRALTPALTTTAGAFEKYQGIWLQPSAYQANDPSAGVLRNYQTYVVKEASFEWQPYVSTGFAGTVYMAYFDNPEFMEKYARGFYSVSEIASLVRSAPEVVSGPIWMPLTFRPRTVTRPRLPKFAVNSQIPILAEFPVPDPTSTPPNIIFNLACEATRNGLNNTTQGLCLVYVETATSGTGSVVGQVFINHLTHGYDLYNGVTAAV